MPLEMAAAEEWPPPEARLQGSLFYGESHLRRGEYLKAFHAFARAADVAEGDDAELTRGLMHLAAAGQMGLCGDARGTERQLAHAHRRLERFLPSARRLDLTALLEGVEHARVR